MMNTNRQRNQVLRSNCLALIAGIANFLWASSLAHANVAQVPLFLTQGVEPQVMLTLSNDHQLFFEAYPDYLDLDGDGSADRHYVHQNDYYGYFDSYKCYSYSTSSGRFEPKAVTENKYCDGVTGDWSGNFLNYATMSRMDIVRKILFGGFRREDTADRTVLERAYIPTDAHSWVRYYDGEDLDSLTPFSHKDTSLQTTATSNSSVTPSNGSKSFALSSDASAFLGSVEVGDQLLVYPDDSNRPDIHEPAAGSTYMMGKVESVNTERRWVPPGWNSGGYWVEPGVTVYIARYGGSGTKDGWILENLSRSGVTFCNTTNNANLNRGETVPDNKPPRLSVARGNYSLWDANERYQCRWSGELPTGGADYGINFNNVGATEFVANDRSPDKNRVGLGNKDYNVRVEVCNSSLIGQERCKEYPDGNYKPVGLLQQYGDDNQIKFGLLSGSYLKNKSGGVLRKNISEFSNEVNKDSDGTFKTAPSTGGIVHTLNLLRMSGYGSDGLYTAHSDNCSYHKNSFDDGQCTGWGNPQSEIFMEAIRYFAATQPTSAFTFTGDDRLTGLKAQTWQDTIPDELYCAPLNVINFNSSVASYDRDQLSTVSDIPGISSTSDLDAIVNRIGASEGVNGNDWFVGEAGTNDNQLCTSKTIGGLADIAGLCPEAPRLGGGYDVAGLAHHAYTNDLRPDMTGEQLVKTFAVALAPAVPRIDIPSPGTSDIAATILPACRSNGIGGNCAIVDFKIVRQDVENGTGLFLINWEDSEQGGDYDQDMYGTLEYVLSGNQLTITTKVAGESTPQDMAFGYVINGTTQDGFHAHSGINGFTRYEVGVASCNNCRVDDGPTSHTYTLSSGAELSGLLENPMFYAAKWGGYDKQANFPDDAASWDANNDGLPDNYYFAIDPSKLATDLERVFADILRSSSAAASIAANSSSLSTETSVYQASFNSQNWSGDLRSFSIDSDGDVSESYDWSAASVLDSKSESEIANRNIFTNTPVSATGADDGVLLSSTGTKFKWGDASASVPNTLTEAQKLLLRKNLDDTQASEEVGELRVAYLRGDRSNERTPARPTGMFRERSSRMGDIVNSNPQYVYQQNFGYASLATAKVGNSTVFSGISDYSAFKTSTASRPPVVIVGANDGMLHGFNASEGLDGGKELFAYIPSGVIRNLAEFTQHGYTHRYYVDGSPRVSDAWLGSSIGWKTIVVGSTGAGGNSIFALDVTDPESVTENSFLWEFSHPDIGSAIQQPTIAPMANGKFAVIVSSGYSENPADTGGRIWILDAATGRPIETIELPDSGQLGSPLAVDLNNDRIVDRIYVGDSLGKLWRIDTDDTNAGKWDVPSGLTQGQAKSPLFEAPEGQPITAPLASAFNAKGQHMVYFGTGSFFRQGDNVVGASPDIQAFYGIVDEGAATLTVADLLEQEILLRVTQNGIGLTAVSDNPLSDEKGWYMDLVWASSRGGPGPEGERVSAKALVRGDRIIFTSLIPSSDPCAAGGQSWLYELDASSGSRLSYSVFDVSGDLQFDEGDYIEIVIDGETVAVPVSGLDPDIGIINTPTVLRDLGGDERKVFTGSSGQIISIPERGSMNRGRQTWEQIR